MDASNIKEHHGNIYTAKVNGIIPWAGIQRPAKWVGGDPNPGSAFTVHEDGSWEVRRGYFMYKQVTRAGQPGMAVARTMAMDSEIALIGFAANGTKNPDAFVLVNLGKTKQVQVTVTGSSAKSFAAFRTTEDEQERYAAIGDLPAEGWHGPVRGARRFGDDFLRPGISGPRGRQRDGGSHDDMSRTSYLEGSRSRSDREVDAGSATSRTTTAGTAARTARTIRWLSGAKGYTYGAGDMPPKCPRGNGGIWRWVTDPEKPDFWQKAIARESSRQMQYLHDFLAETEWWKLEPAHELIRNQPDDITRRMVLAKIAGRDFAVAYLPDKGRDPDRPVGVFRAGSGPVVRSRPAAAPHPQQGAFRIKAIGVSPRRPTAIGCL